MRRKVGIALMVGGAAYTAWRVYKAKKAGVPLDAWIKNNFATSGAVPVGVAVALGAYLVWA
jgi:hypothetical protein